MKTKAMAYLATLVLAIGCATPENDVRDVNTAVVKETPVQAENAADAQNCFDLKMEKWYEAFNQYQDKGFDMKMADQKAVADAEKFFEECQRETDKRMASSDEASRRSE